MRTLLHIAAILAATLPASSRADVVVLNDGDSLSGNLVRVTDATLVFRTTLEGQIMAPMDAVAGITTQNNLAVTLLDESVLYGRFVYSSDRQQLLPLNGDDPRSIRLSNVVEATVIPNAVASSEEDIRGWRASLGLSLRHDETERSRTRPEARIELNVDQPKASLHASLRAAGGDGEETLRGVLEAQGKEGMVPYASVRAEHDPHRALRLRSDFTLGVDRPFIDDGRGTLRAMAGLNLARESWDNIEFGRIQHETDRDTDLNLRLQLSYEKPLTDEWQVRSVLDILPNLSDWGQIRARSETELTYAVTSQLHLRFDLFLDYDSHPDVPGPDEIGASLGAGIQMNF